DRSCGGVVQGNPPRDRIDGGSAAARRWWSRELLWPSHCVTRRRCWPPPPPQPLSNGLARPPPMGWNDWNAYGCNVSESVVEQTAQYMASSGMKAAGYDYVNIDDCWLKPQRDASGNLVADPTKFPDGIAAVAAYAHALGLKLGIYEDDGTATCAGFPGSLGHEQQDANTFAAWGIDSLKYHNCNDNGNIEQSDQAMRDALAATGRPILFSLS